MTDNIWKGTITPSELLITKPLNERVPSIISAASSSNLLADIQAPLGIDE